MGVIRYEFHRVEGMRRNSGLNNADNSDAKWHADILFVILTALAIDIISLQAE